MSRVIPVSRATLATYAGADASAAAVLAAAASPSVSAPAALAIAAPILTSPDAPDAVDETDIAYMLVAKVNGQLDSQTQGVQVEWVNDDERLVLPEGISATADGRHTAYQAAWAVIQEYWTSLGAGPHTLVAINASFSAIPDGTAISTGTTGATPFVGTGVSVRTFAMPDGTIVPAGTAGSARQDIVMVVLDMPTRDGTPGVLQLRLDANGDVDSWAAVFAATYRMNYDPRDYRALADPIMTMDDSYWQQQGNYTLTRMQSKLCGYTVTSIACLNYMRLNRQPLLAWTRAYLVSAGCLHNATSAHNVEYGWSNTRASRALLDELSVVHRRDPDRILRVAYSVGALFGEEHLARDHTFRANDQVMQRVNKSYFDAMRTVITPQEQTHLTNDQRHLHRTCCHPFGLAQMYYVARWGAINHRIAEPLQVRSSVTPPPIQRIHIVSAAMEQVVALPIGTVVKSAYGNVFNIINAERDKILASPPSYSALHAHYGIVARLEPSQDSMAAANALMPIVIGFAEAFYVEAKGTGAERRKGLALAASFGNIKREQSGIVTFFTVLFETYADGAVQAGLETYLIKQIQNKGGIQTQAQIGGNLPAIGGP